MSMHDSPVDRPPDAHRGSERRAAVRYLSSEEYMSLQNSCKPVSRAAESSWQAYVHDLSTGGMGLRVTRRFEPGTLLRVDLHATDARPAHTVLVRVVRAMPQEDDSWMLGCAFIHKLTDTDLLGML
jgi:hypothetical protein